MAGNYVWVDDDDDDDYDDDTPKAKPQELPAPARKHLRKLENRNKELEAKVAEYEKATRASSLAELVKAKGYAPAVAGFIPENVQGDDAITKWLDDNGGIFAKTTTDNTDNDADSGVDDGVEDEVVAAQIAMQRATERAMTPTAKGNLMSQILNAGSKDELDKLLNSAASSATVVR
jgi:hypothetical protein